MTEIPSRITIRFNDEERKLLSEKVIDYCQRTGNGYGVNTFLGCATSEFLAIQEYFGYPTERAMSVVHISINPSSYEIMDIEYDLLTVATESADFYRGHQMVFGIHTDTGRRHIHMAVNPVSFVDGRTLSLTEDAQIEFRRFVHEAIQKRRNTVN